MTVTLFVGDLHAKPHLLPRIGRAADRHRVDRIVLLGDVCDDWTVSANMQVAWMETFTVWAKEQTEVRELVPLLGNHDLPYWMDKGPALDCARTLVGFPGHTARVHDRIRTLMHMLPFRIAWAGDGIVASHAGFTESWGRNTFHERWDEMADLQLADEVNSRAGSQSGLRDLYLAVGRARGGKGTPGPLWADRSELVRDNDPSMTQVVGHTPVPMVMAERGVWFCDTLSTTQDGRPIGDGSLLLHDSERRCAFSEVRI